MICNCYFFHNILSKKIKYIGLDSWCKQEAYHDTYTLDDAINKLDIINL